MTIVTTNPVDKRKVSQMFDYAPKSLPSLLIGRSKKLKISRRDNYSFGDITQDRNPIHRDDEVAKKSKFLNLRKTPIIGMLLASVGGQFIRNVREIIKAHDISNAKPIIKQTTSFKNPVYPLENLELRVNNYIMGDIENTLEINCFVREKIVANISSVFGDSNFIIFPRKEELGDKLISRDYVIERSTLKEMYRCIKGDKKQKSVPHMLPVSFVGRTLLDLLEEKTGEKIGANLSTDFTFVNKPEVGKISVDIYSPRKIHTKSRNGVWLYKFGVVCSQEEKPLNYGKVLVATPNQAIKP